ncbi:MAG: tautomerase family protein [Acidimicrobiaceae bacterium]|nr:tautomerase family protein [Acidimicrobiaceae bacterium]
MPFVDITLAQGKPSEYVEAVSQAVHHALVAELGMKPDDYFQVIHQHHLSELKFNRNFRGGPRSDDWIVFTITDGLERGEPAKREFYKTLVRLLAEDPGIRPADVFVMMTVTPPENFSFADGVIVTDVATAEPLASAAETPGTRGAYTRAEMAAAITELFKNRDRRPIMRMLRDDVVLRVPATLPYGGEFTGVDVFGRFFAGTPGGGKVWDSFTVHLDEVIESDDHLIAQLTNTAIPKGSDKAVVFQNLWLFKVTDGRFASAQLYADTAAVQPPAA